MLKKSPVYYLKSASIFGWGENSASLDRQRVQLLNKFVAGKKVLDIGCGLGLYVDYLVRCGFEATGLDFVSKFVNFAKRAKKGNFIKGEMENLPFKDNEFDTVVLFNILEHGDDRKILEEAKRVAGKRILVIVPKVVDEILSSSGIIFRHYLDKSHLREYQRENLEALAKKTGLKLSHIEAVHPLYNETIFLALFDGALFLKKVIRKAVFFLLPKKIYPTEFFAVFEKQ